MASLINSAPLKPSSDGAVTLADAIDYNAKALGDWRQKLIQEGVDKGLVDPETHWPTQAGLINAAQQYGGALVAGTSAPKPSSIAARIAGYAEKLGYQVDRSGSAQSSSSYLTLSHDALPDSLKVRVADHNLPPSYGPPGDYDVHARLPREESINWAQAVRGLANKVGAEVPGPVKAALSRIESPATPIPSISGTPLASDIDLLRASYPDAFERGTPDIQSLAKHYETQNPNSRSWSMLVSPEGKMEITPRLQSAVDDYLSGKVADDGAAVTAQQKDGGR
jgi:hypothetical protein